MKKSKLFIIAGLLTLVLVVNRFADPMEAARNEISIYKQIENQMPFPDFAKGEHVMGKVIVEFKCDKKGKVEILNMNYSNAKLKTYVSERLSNMTIQLPSNNAEDIYRVEFSFNLL